MAVLKILAASAVTAMLSFSCTLFMGSPSTPGAPSSLDLTVFQKSYMSSYYAERAGGPAGVARSARALTPFSSSASIASRATVPVNQLATTAFASLVGTTTSLANYPEPGQTSAFSLSIYATTPGGFKVYDVTVTTSFPSTDARKSYVEEYYVADVTSNPGFSSTTSDMATAWTSPANLAADGVWTVDDPVVKADSSSPSGWRWDQAARVRMVLTFRDGSTRNETIVSSSLSGGPLFDPAAFDVNGSLDLSQAFLPATSVSPYDSISNSGVIFSSVVMYYVTPSTTYNFWFWSGSSAQTILGIRYYTEVADPATGTYTAYTVNFEKAIDQLTTTGGSFTTTLKTVLVGSTFTTLAESVLRQQVVYGLGSATSGSTTYAVPTGTGAMTTNMQSRVVNIAGQKDFYLSQLNSDNVSLSSWASSTLYTPTGDATEILAGDSTAGVFVRDQQTTPATGTLPYAVLTTDIAGSGDLATLFTSIIEGAYIQTGLSTPTVVSPSIAISSPGSSLSFNGQQSVGTTVSTSVPSLANAGSLEAWVYINALTDTAGIIHKGVLVNFTDECWSLQGWGSNGQIGIILDQAGTGNTYDSVLSKTKLNTKKWYYLVATWDRSTKKIALYINGALNNSGTMVNTASGVRDNASAILLGSQLPSSYSTTYGYFGLDGKIVGASASPSVLTATQIANNYAAYKTISASW
ncbi:MAG TPA: LamG-like jellyroll fold domain-containing protein [Rectinemataceae bacterium]|nr:LamG-like jellyroll fold domain-containing protein [Rectinemataceae bacterium]